ncbi:hypothetical protein NQ314_012951 [Rhamnusium bicolor]|uniref:Uncharacterized protein n=1 Tax=Rhamnusium bicolor TaxID=1586634 RepID=A0AAV8X9E1_9CUCU|nr:hypothetical protein NQ314_012951 [Rhamnusium bicolor]
MRDLLKMGKITNLFLLALFITVIHGFPQQHRDRPSNKAHTSTPPAKTNVQKQETVGPLKHRPVRDTEEQPKPLDRSQISTLPATVDFKKKDTVTQNDDQNRKTRDTEQQSKPLDRSQISTLPATVNFKKQDTLPEKSSEESNSRETRGAENSKQRLDSSSYQPNPPLQTYRSNDDNKPTYLAASNPYLTRDTPKPSGPSSHLTKDVPVSSHAQLGAESTTIRKSY